MGAGVYEIAVDISGISADNYSFVVFNPGQDWDSYGRTTALLTVQKRMVTAVKSSDEAVSKTYDGTNEADMEESLGKLSLAGVTGNDKSGVMPGDVVTLKADSAYYNSKNVNEANKITVSGLALSAGKENYELVNSAIDINGSITAKKLTITVNSQTISYGSAANTYTAEFNGLVKGETILSDNLVFTCNYNTAVPAMRNKGEYTINVAYAEGYSNSNYKESFVAGKLTVEKKEIKVYGESYEITYNLHSIPAYSLRTDNPYMGFVYDETFDTITGKVSDGDVIFSCKDSDGNDVTNVSIPDEYTINMDLNGLTSDNYTFTAVPGKITIQKYELTVTGITVGPKVYDKTRYLKDMSSVSYEGIEYGDNLRTEDKTYLMENNLVCVEVISKTDENVYNSKDAGTDKEVTLKIQLTGYLAERYTLTSDAVVVHDCVIEKKELKVTADDKYVNYGSVSPLYTVSYDGFAADENKSVLGGTLVYECSYTNTSDVEEYIITPSGYTSDNYEIKYVNGKLTVKQSIMNAKAPYWDASRPGTIIWNRAASIGNVDPYIYTLKLYKDSTAVGAPVEVDADTLEYDFSNLIRQSGAGLYTVGITVTPSVVSNEGYKNVKAGSEVYSSSSADVAYRTLRAAKVTMLMAEDAVSLAGVAGITQPVYINETGKNEYIIIAGEEDTELGVTVKNATGYKVKSIEADSESADYFTITAGTMTDTSHKAAITAKHSLTESDVLNAEVTVTLQAAAPTLKISMEQINTNHDPDDFGFGYGEEIAPKYQVTPDVVNDNVTSEGYTYTYTWAYKTLGGSYVTMESDSVNNTMKWPVGFNANAYEVRCTVTATRKDNGMSVKTSEIKKLYISRKDFNADVIINGWKYGEARVKPYVTYNPEQGAVTYQYCKVNEGVAGTYTTSIPTEAGTYLVKAHIAQTTNYNEFTTDAKEFTITKAEFSAVDETKISMGSSDTAPYGLIKWDKVPEISENAGANPASVVKPSYAVMFAKKTDETEGAVALADIDSSITGGDRISYGGSYYDVLLVKTGEDCLTANSYDFTAYIKEEGNYSCFIQVYPGEYTSDITVDEFGEYNGERDVDYSTVSVFSATLEFNGSLDVKHDGVIVNRDSDGLVELVYDGLNTTLEMNYNMSGISGVTYKWYKNSIPVQDSASNIITLKNVADSGVYVCEIYINGIKQYVSPYQTVTITKRKITIQAAGDKKVYDETPLKNDSYNVTNTEPDEGLAAGDKVALVKVTGSQTNVGKSDNVAGDAKIHIRDSGEDVTDNYDITYLKGTLEVTKATPELTILTENMDKIYDGAVTSNPEISYLGVKIPDSEEDIRRDLIRNPAGASTVVFTYYKQTAENVYDKLDGAPKDAGVYKIVVSAEAGSNYNAANKAERTFEIKKRNLTIVAASDEKVYDSTPLVNNGYDKNNTALNEGLALNDVIVSVTVTGTITNVGTCDNIPGNACICVGNKDGENVTANYNISYVKGTLKVTPAEAQLSIETDTMDKIYDGVQVTAPDVKFTGVNGIDLIENPEGASLLGFKYYKKAPGNRYDAIEGEPKNAGEYKVVVSSSDGDNYKMAVDELEFTISKRNITLKAGDANKTYDGTPLVKNAYDEINNTNPDEGLANPSAGPSDVITECVIKGSITNVGSCDNLITSVIIQVGDKDGEDVTDCYNITLKKGSLDVTKAVSSIVITSCEDKEYDGATVVPSYNYNGDGIVTFIYMDENMQLLDNPPVKVGSYYVQAASNSSVNYFEATSEVAEFSISKTVMEEYIETPSGETEKKFDIKVGDAETHIYTGFELTPELEITYHGNVLTEGIDYEIRYFDNIEEGTAGIDIVGLGSYSGSMIKNFQITKRKIVVITESGSKDYDGTELVCNGYTTSKYFDEATGNYIDESGLAQNHSAIVSVNGSQTQVGISNNTIDSIMIADGDGNDVTSNYELIYKLGTLEVKKVKEEIPPQNEPSGDNGKGDLPITGDNRLLYWMFCILAGSMVIVYKIMKRESK
ncbi:MAG: MBG domain-containing protein [Butyrivibrio sp.]